jgi:CRP-like cAMP-binding protein
MKLDSVIRIQSSLKDSFFKYWFEFLRPFHNLTNRELEVIACFAKHRYELSKVISDESVLDKVLMSEDTKRQIREECSVTQAHFPVIMSELRKKGVIEDNKIILNSSRISEILSLLAC